MAQSVKAVANNSIRHATSPGDEPPRPGISHPQFEQPSEQRARGREDSVTTLTDGAPVTDSRAADRRGGREDEPDQEAVPDRPSLAAQKFKTESSKAVGVGPAAAQRRRRSTGGRPSYQNSFSHNDPTTSDSSSDSDSSTDDHDDEFHLDLSRQRSLPELHDLAARELNRARMHPRTERRRRNLTFGIEDLRRKGRIGKDGRLKVRISDAANTKYLARALGGALEGHLLSHPQQARQDAPALQIRYPKDKDIPTIPRMNIVIMVIGSRGDIQPFLKIGQILRDKYGHRVRVATHPAFRKFVQDEIGLEFFSIGGDPAELMSFMVRNPGLIPSFETIASGEVGRRREQMYSMFNRFWRACINTTDDERDTANLETLGNKFPFIADAIIANPVSFAHYHCAEKLGIPLHLVFTFPYTPTSSFPHPLANVKASNVDREYLNYMSYPLVDLMTWQGLGDLVNRFRVKTLGLEPVSTLWAPGQVTRMRVPITYLWSPGLVPKPKDWGPEVDIAGYVFLDLATSYKPPEELVKFLTRSDEDTRPIIYTGFGSISGIDDPRAFCQLIFDAVEKAGVRAVVSRGWGGMGDGMDIPDSIHMVDNVPHDWLFPQLDAVVHHGGAGTTAIGLKFGKPTMIVPFFGDQPFWASMIARRRAGAREVWPLKKLTVDRFVTSIKQCLEPESKDNAQAIAKSIVADGDGAENAIDSFHRALVLSGKHSIRCGIFDDRVAVWQVRHTGLRLSALAADLLVENKQLHWNDLDLVRNKKWADFSGPGEPVTGAGGVIVSTFQEAWRGMSGIHGSTKADLKRIEKHRRKKKGRTVADVVAMPGRMALKARAIQEDGAADGNVLTKVNLSGDAEPVRKSIIPGTADNEENDRPRNVRTNTMSTLQDPAPVLLAKDVSKGFGHSFRAIMLLPMELLNAVTLGFRNAPRIYGDRTVRPPPQNVRGFREGIKVAGREFWLGLYDGTTGVVRIPSLDRERDGWSGLPKGVIRGLGGLVLKPVAGTLALANYTNRGLYASLRRLVRDTEKTERWIRKARSAQGIHEVQELREEEQKRHELPGQLPEVAGGDSNTTVLNEARNRVMVRWTSFDHRQVERAREKEKRGLSHLHARLSRSNREPTD